MMEELNPIDEFLFDIPERDLRQEKKHKKKMFEHRSRGRQVVESFWQSEGVESIPDEFFNSLPSREILNEYSSNRRSKRNSLGDLYIYTTGLGY